jgi:hypothetical protein
MISTNSRVVEGVTTKIAIRITSERGERVGGEVKLRELFITKSYLYQVQNAQTLARRPGPTDAAEHLALGCSRGWV